MNNNVIYEPEIGRKQLLFAGDILTVKANVERDFEGQIFLRNNINQSEIRFIDIIEEVEQGKPNLDRGWYDTPLKRVSPTLFEVHIPLLMVGHFSYKPYIILEDSSQVWAYGDNNFINVEPSEYRSNNTVYCAFVRQFGATKNLAESALDDEHVLALDKKGYSIIPPSGKFRDLIGSLDHIINDLGCRILHLLPINPTPTTYGRMGRYGSPYAALDFTAVNPELAQFDLKATPLEQFIELVDETHKRQAKVFIDIAINHTGWAAKIHETNPEWLHRHDDGRIHQPGAWGTTWEDLTELDHTNRDLWQYLAEVFLIWCERGVDGFRCDAGYMIPAPAWTYITAKVRQKYPNAIFLLEGLGGPWAVTEDLLNTANLNWAYSELFQNYSQEQIHEYMKYSKYVSETQGLMIHYAETHDNSRLADKSITWAKMRTSLSALLSHNGAFGFTNGVEWFAKEKIFVHRSSGLNWGAEENQVDHISTMTQLLKNHPAFSDGSTFHFIQTSNDAVIAAIRFDKTKAHPLLVIINLECEKSSAVHITIKDLPESLHGQLKSFIHNQEIHIDHNAQTFEIELAPGQSTCLGKNYEEVNLSYNSDHTLKLQLMNLFGLQGMEFIDLDFAQEIKLLKADPLLYFRIKEVLTTSWNFPEDTKRHVLFTSYSVLVACCPSRFSMRILDQNIDSFIADDGKHYALFNTPADIESSSYESVSFIHYGDTISRFKSDILFLTDADKAFTGEIPDTETPLTCLDTNGRGGMIHLPLSWPNFFSKYDCLLGANLSADFPENRHIMWRRLRLYSQHNSLTYELSDLTLESRDTRNGQAELIFRVPSGSGRFVRLKVLVGMIQNENATMVKIERLNSDSLECLSDNDRIEIIMRPDIEDRNFHMETKAISGIEASWKESITTNKHGFSFAPDHNRKLVITSQANFTLDAEWSYNHFQKIEAERGLESNTDIYSPGFLKISLKGGDTVDVLGQVITENDNELALYSTELKTQEKNTDLSSILIDAMKHYIVKRGELKTVIAGYPWFLDWGRDTLICVRGIIAAGMTSDVRKILLQFGNFEEDGTLPNMIHGGDATNRDTSDAPLWYFVACEDLMKAEGNNSFLDESTGTRTIKDILVSLAENIIKGTPNGIKMDDETGLVYSPSHFTWMDTNYPAGTPRQGYPVEIQSLWFKALTLLSQSTEYKVWTDLAAKVKENFVKYFWDDQRSFLSDCLHSTGEAAKDSPADDALRSNQLFAVTLGIVDGEIAKQVIQACEQLLIPGAIRSLAEREVEFPLPVKSDGQVLNDPHNPYWGQYEGDEDTRRKPAYHNGTAWTWPFPSYSEALYLTYGNQAKKHAKAILNSCRVLLSSGCLEQIPEVIDGDAPHRQRGCDAQAWGVTEAYRVWKILNDE
jgi:starch synthase (maltosyl-transferring)